MTSLSELQQRFLNIATDGRLSPKQKSNFLALEAEACIPYMPISEALREAMSDGVIC
ncbi:YjjI family glycine radical enzyme, partial [Vibrio sp. 2089]|nr:YjjI family glycine radical enzyme [Vibrio sp. 2089]